VSYSPDRAEADIVERAVGDLRALIRAVTDDSAAGARAALADTTVRIKLSDGDAVTLFLDREPVELGTLEYDAEIALAMTASQLEQLIRGELALAMEIAHGRIVYSGPVRKFLRIIPILRRVARDWLAGPDHAAPPRVEAVERS
jgi:hypothetical protein